MPTDPQLSEAVSATSLPVRQFKETFLKCSSLVKPRSCHPGRELSERTSHWEGPWRGWQGPPRQQIGLRGVCQQMPVPLPPTPGSGTPGSSSPHPEVSDQVKAVTFLSLGPGGRHCEERRGFRVQGKPRCGPDCWLNLSLAPEETAAWREPFPRAPSLTRSPAFLKSEVPEKLGREGFQRGGWHSPGHTSLRPLPNFSKMLSSDQCAHLNKWHS